MDTKDKKICQNCKYHDNKPSRCSIQKHYVPRKHTCDVFKRRTK